MLELVQLANQIPNDSVGVILKPSFSEFLRHLKFLHRQPESSIEINDHQFLQTIEGYVKQLCVTNREHTPAPVIVCELLFSPRPKTETRVFLGHLLNGVFQKLTEDFGYLLPELQHSRHEMTFLEISIFLEMIPIKQKSCLAEASKRSL